MTTIKTLSDLRKAIGNEAVDLIFTEYVMEMVAKAQTLEKIEQIVRNHGTAEEIEAIL